MYVISRLLVLLGLVDSVHLVTTLCSFSLPTLSRQFRDTTYHHTLPYTLPLAQVITGHCCTYSVIFIALYCIVMYLLQTTLVMSVYMTISLTVERFLSVVHPLYTIRNRCSCDI